MSTAPSDPPPDELPAAPPAGTIAHHDRVRAVLFIGGLETARRVEAGEPPVTAAELTARLIRVRSRLDRLRPAPAGDGPDHGDPDAHRADAAAWKLAAYDAALAELCVELGLSHSLDDDTVSSEAERQRVELELLSCLLPLG